MDHAEPQHVLLSPGGVVAIENPIRWGRGLPVKREPQVKALLWAWATCYLDQFFLGMSRQPGQSSFPGNPVTAVEAGQHREDHLEWVFSTFRVLRIQGDAACSSLRGNSPYPSQLALTPLVIQHSFTVVYSVPGPVLGAEDREDSRVLNREIW